MNFDSANRIARALLYEGYLLYPYRVSAVKNQRRWTFGCLLSPDYSLSRNDAEGSFSRTECLLVGDEKTEIEIRVRFLQIVADLELASVAILEREVTAGPLRLPDLRSQARQCAFEFLPIQAMIDTSLAPSDDRLFSLRVVVRNLTRFPSGAPLTRDESLPFALLSSHIVLGIANGKFLSMQDPPNFAREAADSCRSVRSWPVLIGDPVRCDMLLSAPIILSDFPEVAPESPADLFDSTEMDEMLTLRIQTLTAKEKQEMAATDPRAQVILERIESLEERQVREMHGVWRMNEPTLAGSARIEPGMRVRLRPKGNADVYDLALAGKTALVVSIEEDFEDRIYVSVALDDDPGQDYGIAGRPGHRFYFAPDEVEPIKPAKRILIAGIGNIFFGDDAFGVEVIRHLFERPWPDGVVIKDFGIRGYDLACSLQDGYDAVILVDAIHKGGSPGTLYVIEPETELSTTDVPMEMHHLDFASVIKMVRQMGGTLPCLRVVGCEPTTLEPNESVALSEPLQRVVPSAIALIEKVVADLRQGPEEASDE